MKKRTQISDTAVHTTQAEPGSCTKPTKSLSPSSLPKNRSKTQIPLVQWFVCRTFQNEIFTLC